MKLRINVDETNRVTGWWCGSADGEMEVDVDSDYFEEIKDKPLLYNNGTLIIDDQAFNIIQLNQKIRILETLSDEEKSFMDFMNLKKLDGIPLSDHENNELKNILKRFESAKMLRDTLEELNSNI